MSPRSMASPIRRAAMTFGCSDIGSFLPGGLDALVWRWDAARARANAEAAAAVGGRIVGTYWTLGQYDFVSIIEAPSDEAVTAGILLNGARGFGRTVTMRAFTTSEFEGIIGQAKAAGGSAR